MYFLLFTITILFLLRSNSRISALEERLNANQASGRKEIETEKVQLEVPMPVPTPEKVFVPTTEQEGEKKSLLADFEVWLKEDWMLKLGALFLILGTSWFVRYAFMNDWIGPVGRITLGVLAGIAIMVFGWYRISKYRNQGSVFVALGTTIASLTIFAAYQVYGFFTPLSALGVVFLFSVATALTSVRYKVPSLALVGLILAGTAPSLLDILKSGNLLFSYLLLVIAGTLWVAVLNGQRSLTVASLVLFGIHSEPYIAGVYGTNEYMLFVYLFTAMCFVANISAILKSNGRDMLYDLVTAGGSAFLLLTWIGASVPEYMQSIVTIIWAIIFAGASFIVAKVSVKRAPVYVYTAVSTVLLAAATAMELEGAMLIIAYTIECLAIAISGFFLTHNARVIKLASFLFVLPAILSIESIVSPAWRNSILHEDFFTLLILALSLFVTGAFFLHKSHVAKDEDSIKFSSSLLVFGAGYAYILVWLSTHAVLDQDKAVLISMIVYTIVGIYTYLRGVFADNDSLRAFGGVTVLFVTARLLLIDVWQMSLVWRISTFFIIGIMFISTAFLNKMKKD